MASWTPTGAGSTGFGWECRGWLWRLVGEFQQDIGFLFPERKSPLDEWLVSWLLDVSYS